MVKNIVLGKVLFVSACLFAAGLVVSSGAQAAGTDMIQIKTGRRVLDNGLTVLVTPMPANPTVSVYMLIKAGSATEGPFLGSGISHFMEHMLFKGTENRGVGEISSEVQALGGTINASTTFDYTIYTITVPEGHFSKALDIMADMTTRAVFDDEELEKEREVVYGEMRLYRDRPERHLSELVFSSVYHSHPYGTPVIGYESLLAALERDDFFRYYKDMYTPNNMVLSIAGRVDPVEVYPQIEKAFAHFQRRSVPLRDAPPEPEQITARRHVETYPTNLSRLALCFPTVSVNDPDMFPLDVLAKVLGQGESSRLYRRLFSEEQIVRSISAANYTPQDPGLFEVFAVLDPENVDAVIATVREEIQRVQAEGLDVDELAKAKQQVLSEYVREYQTSGDVAWQAAVNEALVADAYFSQRYVEKIAAVTNEDIRQAARRYLTPSRESVVILNPESAAVAGETPAAEIVEPRVEKKVLKNGLTLLWREDPNLPMVSVTLALNGGVRYESEQTNGISQLTSQLWTQGTNKRTAAQIAEEVESRGASLSGFSGRNSFGLGMEVLSGDLDFGVDLLLELITSPAFPREELVKEKQKLRTALLARDDEITALTSLHLRGLLFTTSAFRFDGIGTQESLDALDRAAVVKYFRDMAAPSNMVLSVFGDIDAKKVIPRLESALGKLPAGQYVMPEYSETPPDNPVDEAMSLDKVQSMVMIGFQGPDFDSPDRAGMEVLAAVLGSSFSGRMFTSIRDEFGQAYTLGGSYIPGKDVGFVYFYVLTSPETADAVHERLAAMIAEIRNEPVGEKELADIKTYLQGSFKMGMETNSAFGFMTALDELYGLGYDHYQGYGERIGAVTAAEIQRLAQTYLDPRHSVTVVTRPAAATATTSE